MKFYPKPYAEHYRRENEHERLAIDQRLQKALIEAARIATELVKPNIGVRRVYLFGSVAKGDPQALDFDIDLAIEGGDRFLAEQETGASAFKIDLVHIEALPAHFRAEVLKRGILLSGENT